jgi:hypothetical protein
MTKIDLNRNVAKFKLPQDAAFLICGGLVLLTVLSLTVSVTSQKKKSKARGMPTITRSQSGDESNVGTLLGRADVLLKGNDISDTADRYYRQVVNQFPDTQQAGYAQYNRGSYWQRKFYIVKERYGKEDKRALTEAGGQYYDFIDKFAERTRTTGLLSDAEFNVALVYLQMGNREYATGWLYKMIGEVAGKDSEVYLYKVVWSSKADDVIDRSVDSNQLAKVSIELINSGKSFEEVVAGIRKWAQGQRKS